MGEVPKGANEPLVSFLANQKYFPFNFSKQSDKLSHNKDEKKGQPED